MTSKDNQSSQLASYTLQHFFSGCSSQIGFSRGHLTQECGIKHINYSCSCESILTATVSSCYSEIVIITKLPNTCTCKCNSQVLQFGYEHSPYYKNSLPNETYISDVCSQGNIISYPSLISYIHISYPSADANK